MGVIAFQIGQHEMAVERIRRAIELNGTESVFHNNLGNAFKAQGKLDEAMETLVQDVRRQLRLEYLSPRKSESTAP